MIAGGKRQRQRLDDLPGQIVLQLEQVGERAPAPCCEESSVPEGASSIWVETRTWSPARSSVPGHYHVHSRFGRDAP